MIKVCHMTSGHRPEDVRIFHKECVSLAKAGFDVYLVERGNSYEKDGVHIIGVGEERAGRFRGYLTVARKVFEAAQKVNADIYHFHDPELLPYGLKLKQSGKKVIFDSHENFADSIMEKKWIPSIFRRSVYYLYSYYQKKVCKRLDAIICAAENLIPFLSTLNPNVTAVANYPILDDSKFIPPSFLNKAVVFAGGIIEQWNHEYIIKAISNIEYCTYNLCGSCGESYLHRLQNLGGWKQVVFHGVIPHQQVANILANSSIGLAILTPGLNTDGKNGNLSNIKIFEEMRAGLPVICTNFVRWKDFVERYNCGICVDPHNVEEISNAIRFLLDNPEKAREMGRNGRRAVEEEFNWATQEKKLLNLYNELINDRRD